MDGNFDLLLKIYTIAIGPLIGLYVRYEIHKAIQPLREAYPVSDNRLQHLETEVDRLRATVHELKSEVTVCMISLEKLEKRLEGKA